MCDKLINSPTLQSLRMLIGMVMRSQGKPSQATIDISYDNFLDSMRDEQWDTKNARRKHIHIILYCYIKVRGTK